MPYYQYKLILNMARFFPHGGKERGEEGGRNKKRKMRVVGSIDSRVTLYYLCW